MKRKLCVLPLLVLLAAGGPRLLAAGAPPPSEVEIRVDGLACPFCAFGIEKRLRKVAGVASVRTDVKDGKAVVELKAGAVPDPAALAEAVKRAGFTPRGLRATAAGTVARDTLRLPDGGTVALGGKVPADGSRVVVSGPLRTDDEGRPLLEVESAEEVGSDGQ